MNIKLKRAPVATVPQSERLGSAPLSRDKTPPKSGMRRHNSTTRESSPGPGDYYLPAAFGKKQSHNKFTGVISSNNFQVV